MRILAVAVLLAVVSCTATEEGAPTKVAWLDGELTFRKVQNEAPTAKPSTGYPVPQQNAAASEVQVAQAARQSTDDNVRSLALESFDCAAPDPLTGNDDAARPLVTCDAGEFKNDLGPVFLDGGRIKKATPSPSEYGDGHIVSIEFDEQGAKTWADFTTANVGERVAILINGRVLSAPSIQSPITGGTAQIVGRFTAQEAAQLAWQLSRK